MKKKSKTKKSFHTFFPFMTEKNMFTLKQRRDLRNIIDIFYQSIRSRVQSLRPPVIYNDFTKRSPGRYEIVPPAETKKQIQECLQQSPRYRSIRQQISGILGPSMREELCLLPVEPGAPRGKWHRDVFYYDTKLPPYYITQLIYLDDHSVTSFIRDSEKSFIRDSEKSFIRDSEKSFIRDSNTENQSILFDGRLCHRGEKNRSKKIRYALYISYTAPWYKDEESMLPESFFDFRQ